MLREIQGPLSITLFVLEDMMIRSYSGGGQFGTTYVVSSTSELQIKTPVIVHEKHLSAMKANRAYLLMKNLTPLKCPRTQLNV